MSFHSELNPIPRLIECLDGPGKQFPRMATPADRQSIRDTSKQFNHLCAKFAVDALKRGKVLQWAGLKTLGLLAYGSGHFVARRPLLAIDLRGQGDDLKVKLEFGERGRVLLCDQPRSRSVTLQ